MKKQLLFFVLVFLSFSAFGQFTEVLQNGKFDLPSNSTKVDLATGKIAFWNTDDVATNHNNREGDGTLSMSNTSKGIYQVVDKIPAVATGYNLSFKWTVTYDQSTQDTITMTARIYAFSGSDRSSRRKIDSLNFVMSHSSGTSIDWKKFNGTFTIPAASVNAGDSLVIELQKTKWTHKPSDANLWSKLDSISFKKATYNPLEIINGSFELPSTGAKVDLATGKIPGWTSDDVATNHNNREGGTPGKVSMVNTSKGIYNVIDKISNSGSLYNVNLAWSVSWDGSTSDTIKMTAKLSHFSGSDRSTRTPLDSIKFMLSHSSGNTVPWTRFSGSFPLIPDAAPYAGDSLVLELRISDWSHNKPENNLWSLIDSVSVLKATSGALVSVTGISLSTATHDSLEILRNITITPAITPLDATVKTLTWASSDTTIAKVSGGVVTAKDKKGTVTITATSVSDPSVKKTIDLKVFRNDVTSIALTLPDTIEVGSLLNIPVTIMPENASDKTVIWSVSKSDFAVVDASGNLTTKARGDVTITATSKTNSDVKISKTIRVKQSYVYTDLTVTNPGFELPDDNVKYQNIGNEELPGWHSNDVTSNHNGREAVGPLRGKYRGYSTNIALPFYQAVDVASANASTYQINYLTSQIWNDKSATDSMFTVAYLSHYKPGTDRRVRTMIDSVETDITNKYSILAKAVFKVPSNTYSGDSLVIEFKLKTYGAGHVINSANTNSWAAWDSISVQKLSPVTWANTISLTFDGAGDSIKVNSSGVVAAIFNPENATFTDVRWSVSDANLATIDETGILTAKAKGTVVVTATSVDRPSLKSSKNIKIYDKNTGIDNLSSHGISVYPIPSDGNFTIEAPQGSEISITNVSGKLVYKNLSTGDKTNVSLLVKGIYFVQVKTKGNIVTKKILIK